jgi:hypothetical protein
MLLLEESDEARSLSKYFTKRQIRDLVSKYAMRCVLGGQRGHDANLVLSSVVAAGNLRLAASDGQLLDVELLPVGSASTDAVADV